MAASGPLISLLWSFVRLVESPSVALIFPAAGSRAAFARGGTKVEISKRESLS